MSRPRLSVGTFGEMLFLAKPNGHIEARARYRDWDGKLRAVQATAKTRRAAEAALKQKLAGRALFKPATGDLTADSTFAELAAHWLEDLDLEGRIAPSTRARYESLLRESVLPTFERLTLRDIGVARCDAFVKQLARKSYNQARQAKSVMRLTFGLAVRHEVLPRNPMDAVARLHKPAHAPDALTPQEVNSIRLAVRFWETGIIPTGPRPDGQLSAIIEVLLGTSARIGEALAVRRRDVDLTSPMPSLAIRGTIITLKGHAPYRQDHPKTAKSRRTVALPPFTAEALRRRLAQVADPSPDALVFTSRNGTLLTMANVRRQLRRVLKLAGIEGVTPHSFRRTVATTIKNNADVELAAELLGHTDTRVTIEHYVRRSEMVNPVTAVILGETLAPDL